MLNTNIHPREIYQRSEEFGLNNSAKMLTEIIDSDADVTRRQEAIKYLGLIGNDSEVIKNSCFSIFENLLISDDDVQIRCEAAKALGRIKHEKGLKPLNWILEQNEVDNQIRLAVLKAIRKIRFQDSEIRLFINELDSNFHSIMDFITIQLLSLDPDILIEKLLESLKNRKISNNHKTELIKLIGYELSSINISIEELSYIKVKYPEILSSLIHNKDLLLENITLVFREENIELLNSIITILQLLGGEIEKDLIKLLLSDDFIVRKNAITLTGKLKLRNAVDLLITNLDNIYSEVSIASIEALGEIGDLSAIPELLDILDIEDISFEYTDLDMKLYILDAIIKIYNYNKEASYEDLYSSLKKENNMIRESVAFILGEIGKEEFVEPLIELLNVNNLDVKKNTVIALGKVGQLESLHDLIKILEDVNSYWLIKKVAVDAMYNIFQKNWYRARLKEEFKRLLNKELALLIDYLATNSDENFKVKLSLIKLLETYGDERALNALLKRVNDFHRVVRIRASNAIKKIEERFELEES